MKRNTWITLGALGAVLVGGSLYLGLRPKEEIKWRQAKVERGNVVQRISATGTLSPLVQVPVGTQVSGTISALYADYNSLVKKGQVIAQIDPTVLETQLKDAQASVDRANATLDDARTQHQRYKRLAAEKLVSDQDLDSKEVALKTALAQLATAKAAFDRAKANLAYCTITAPVDGVVVARAVDVGQTVAASFNTPNLFTIAQDLQKMKLEISIDEADIGQVKVSQPAFFTVDSYPDRQFRGTVAQVRLEPITAQNVVTYKVVMEVQNEPITLEAAPTAEAAKTSKGTGPQVGQTAPTSGPGQPGQGMGLRDMEPAQREALLKRLGFKPEDMADPAKREAIREKFKQMREKGGMAAAPASRPSTPQASRTPGGINAAGGPIYAGNLALRPGMTANVSIVTARRENALRVPAVALRFNPKAFLKEAPKRDEKAATPGTPQQGGARSGGPATRGFAAKREDKVWIMENGKPKEVVVKAGISDGQFTELLGDGLPEGTMILTGVDDAKKNAANQGPAPIGGGGMPRR